MAQHVVLSCDRSTAKGPCGQAVPGNASTKVILDDESYQVDLCEDHRREIAEALAPFKALGRPYTPPNLANIRKVLRDHRGATFTVADVRAWLQQQGREVSYTGRVPTAAIEEYRAAHA